ncbi:Nuclear transcription factor Y subunit B-2 [Nosema bombycis CQ1]|uniref:Nuclear transcription factor Y subunit B-2 n=1 Tax=Nosema bombycis (strain CQ1 / CVCC 102059) TaxID=578461 RepID=R0KX70_NOSB1|nr:Nuclear transcription factor Y subunit B-2 [Nosema bombycis CQ1]|eukprot:EOB15486.1 Nuclear transcription factor Y subunit B-2 [Nosema bombycis CQ1]
MDRSFYKMADPNSPMDYTNNNLLRPTDRLLPIANISKIMKKPIPKEAKVVKDAKELMQKSASEFIAIITCRAKEICENEARKTVTGDDLIRAMDDLDMPYYAELGRKYYIQYRELIKNERMKKHIKSLEYDDL